MSPREAVAILGRRFAEQASEEARCARDIRAAVPLVADVLVREFGVHRVVLFGSVARGAARPDSDIDIALEGLPPGQTFHAMARAAEVAGRNVDLVPMEGPGQRCWRTAIGPLPSDPSNSTDRGPF
jgi:predicted nucleotidyltransferase